MRELHLTPPWFGFIVATRAALAFGAADRIPKARRRTIGLALVAIGAATTVPAAMTVLGSRSRA